MTRFDQYYKALMQEFRFVFRDWGVMIFLFVPIFYAVIYYAVYMPEVIRDMPIAVVDNSGTADSREFSRRLNANQFVEVAYEPASLDEAKNLLLSRQVCGFVVIPSGFGDRVSDVGQAVVGVYADASYFLYYSRMFEAATAVVLDMGSDVAVERFSAAGMSVRQAEALSQPVDIDVKILFNPYNGYATFVLPAVFIIFIQQFLLIGIGVVGGTWHEKRLYRKFCEGIDRPSPLAIMLGKTTAYVAIYIVMLVYLFGFLYKLFGFPMNGNSLDISMFFVPYLLSVVFLSLGLSTVFSRRENAIMMLSVTSVPLLLISGVSWPEAGIPDWLFAIGRIFPSSAGIDGFIRLQTVGASLEDVVANYRWLWILSALFFIFAWYRIAVVIKNQNKEE